MKMSAKNILQNWMLTRAEWIAIASVGASYVLPAVVIGAIALFWPEAPGEGLSRLRSAVNDSSWWMAIGISLIPIIVTPLTHTPVAILVGAIWGPIPAILINWTAKVLGNCINFVLGWFLGPLILDRLTSATDRADLRAVAAGHPAIVFAMYALPPVANDTLSYFLGAVRMNPLAFARISFPAHLGPAATWALVGGLSTEFGLGIGIAIFIIVVLVSVGLWKFVKGRKKGVSGEGD